MCNFKSNVEKPVEPKTPFWNSWPKHDPKPQEAKPAIAVIVPRPLMPHAG